VSRGRRWEGRRGRGGRRDHFLASDSGGHDDDETVVDAHEAFPPRVWQSVNEVSKGQECGVSLERFGAYEPGDIIECYRVDSKQKSLKDFIHF
jgi:hypothetical protein